MKEVFCKPRCWILVYFILFIIHKKGLPWQIIHLVCHIIWNYTTTNCSLYFKDIIGYIYLTQLEVVRRYCLLELIWPTFSMINYTIWKIHDASLLLGTLTSQMSESTQNTTHEFQCRQTNCACAFIYVKGQYKVFQPTTTSICRTCTVVIKKWIPSSVIYKYKIMTWSTTRDTSPWPQAISSLLTQAFCQGTADGLWPHWKHLGS